MAQEIIRGIAREYGSIDFIAEKKILAPVDPSLYDAYIGQYELGPNVNLLVSRQGDRLYIRATDQRQFEIFPESEIIFFPREFEAQISFIKDEMGRVTGLVLRQHGEHSAKKIE